MIKQSFFTQVYFLFQKDNSSLHFLPAIYLFKYGCFTILHTMFLAQDINNKFFVKCEYTRKQYLLKTAQLNVYVDS